MKRYCIKCRAGRADYFDVLSETEGGITIRLTQLSDGNERVSEEFMSHALFEVCFKTGYIYEMEEAESFVA